MRNTVAKNSIYLNKKYFVILQITFTSDQINKFLLNKTINFFKIYIYTIWYIKLFITHFICTQNPKVLLIKNKNKFEESFKGFANNVM